jgi:uncharacterized protein (DUF1786 family)
MSSAQIEDFTRRLLLGTLEHEEVFGSKGHGVFYAGVEGRESSLAGAVVAVTGPQRRRARETRLNVYMAAPHGDMMLSGCFGMLRGFAYRHARWADEIEAALTLE